MREGLVKLATSTHAFWYTVTGGIIGSRMFGAPVLLLTTTGRKSGRPRTTPLMYLQDGDDMVLVASYGGSPKHPAWFLNLRDHPEVEVQVGRERKRVRAQIAGEADRARLWPQVVKMYASYDEYQQKTSRKIPVVILKPTSS